MDPGKSPDLWKKYKVSAVPTIVLVDPATKREVVFEGAKSEGELSEYLKALFAPKVNTKGKRK